MNQIQWALIISYLLISCYFFCNWLVFFFRMFVISTIFWPLTILLSCLEMFKQRKIELSTVIIMLLAMFAFSISYYFIS